MGQLQLDEVPKMYRMMSVLAVAAVMSLMTTQADAADPFRATSDSGISSNALSAMGLSGMRTMTRSESSTVRGQGGVVWGRSTVTVRFFGNVATSENGYRFRGRNGAAGFNISGAALVPPGSFGVAGGFSIAGGW